MIASNFSVNPKQHHSLRVKMMEKVLQVWEESKIVIWEYEKKNWLGKYSIIAFEPLEVHGHKFKVRIVSSLQPEQA